MTPSTPELRDSGVPWIGRIRTDWEVLRGKALFAPRNERSRRDDVHLTPSQQYGVLPQAEYMEITGAKVVLNLTGADNMKHVEPDDFISHLRSFQGGIEHSRHRGKVSMAYTVLTPRAGALPAFYRWALKSEPYIQALQSTTDQLRDGQSIKYGQFGNIPLPVPPLDEQRVIADFLDRETSQIDAMVDAQERLVALLEERRDAVIQRSVTKGIHPPTDLRPTSELWIDSMPEHWSIAPVNYYFEVTLGKMLDAGKPARDGDAHLPYLRAANIQDRGLELSDVKEMPFGPDERARLDIRAGDLMVVEGGAIGTAVLITTDMPGWSFQKTVNRVRSRGRASTAYLRYVIRTIRDRGLFDISGNKSTIAHLTAEKLAATRVPVPPIEEQQQIAAHLDDATRRIDAMIARARESIALMKERREALISAAVTGRIDVRTGIEQVERDLEEARV